MELNEFDFNLSFMVGYCYAKDKGGKFIDYLSDRTEIVSCLSQVGNFDLYSLTRGYTKGCYDALMGNCETISKIYPNYTNFKGL